MRDMSKKMIFFIASVFLLAFLCAGLVQAEAVMEERNSAAETVGLTVGREIFYGTYSTNYFDVDGKTAYCLEPLKDTPSSGRYKVSPLERGKVRKGLYYVYGGPGYEKYKEKFGAIGISSSYSQDDEYCMSHCIVSYLYSGNESAFTGLGSDAAADLRQKAEHILSMPEPPESYYAFLFNTGGAGQVMGGSGKDRTGSIRIEKLSARPEWTKGNPCYTLSGAVFGIYRPGENTPAWTITTDEEGCGELNDIPIGDYEIEEIESPKGFVLKAGRRQIRIDEHTVYQYECTNRPQYYPVQLLLHKKDAETGESKPQGSASLAGAEFAVKYYAGYYDTDPAQEGVKPQRSWVCRTDETGELKLSDESKISGDEFYKNEAGECVLPLGTVTLQEIKPPEGYLLNDTLFVDKIIPDGSGETDTAYHVSEVPEEVLRGDLQIVKFREDEDEKEEQKTPLDGIIFTVTSKTTGEQIEIVTDENGYASTCTKEGNRGNLVYDTYIVSEKNAPEGLIPADDFEITISEEGRTLFYILENKRVFSPVRLIKTDSSTGKVIPLSGAEFMLLDEEKNPISMTVRYPQETVFDTFKTDASGSFILPERLPAGTYYFQEVHAPEGYILNTELIPFEILENHDWDNPFTVTCADEPAVGRFCIKKTDGETREGVEGVKFEIRAKEDILTPEGTVRMEKGSLAGELVTGEDGTAWSDPLYLGKYEIRETEQAPGYALIEETYDAELKYRDEQTEIVTEQIEISNSPTTVIIQKTETGTEKGLSGVRFSVWEKSKKQKKSYVTDENGRIVLKYLYPGNYCIQEEETAAGYKKDDTVREFTVDQSGKIGGKACVKMTIENDRAETPPKTVPTGDEPQMKTKTAAMLVIVSALAAGCTVGVWRKGFCRKRRRRNGQ